MGDCRIEGARIAFLLQRDGDAATRDWVQRTLAIYRRAVFRRGHFAASAAFRRSYLLSCADFRRWLSRRRGAGRPSTPAKGDRDADANVSRPLERNRSTAA